MDRDLPIPSPKVVPRVIYLLCSLIDSGICCGTIALLCYTTRLSHLEIRKYFGVLFCFVNICFCETEPGLDQLDD